ncbi:MAG: hypothetical protein KDC34_14915 [Saprospiraceae bacterium]|nr:hypothetical protein [Saprospiraceae bacterium]
MRALSLILSLAICALFTVNAFAQQPEISNFRPYDKDGLNQFEPPKDASKEFEGVKVRVGGSFTQQFQLLDHSNTADVVYNADSTLNLNQLYDLSPGFNLAVANLNIDAQLADGITMNLVTYLSSRHHSEAWVKGGYLQIDRLPFIHVDAIDNLMDYVTIKAGHMEINYGDQHFRRTDNGNAIHNPFVGNYIIDAFTTEIGGELYYRRSGVLAMVGLTGGEIKGDVSTITGPDSDKLQKRSPVILGKLGYDDQLNENIRLRVTGSVYYTASSGRNTLYGGDRTGSRYYLAMESSTASAGTNFTSGRYNPGFTDQVTAIMGNVFVKAYGLEVFGTYENISGRSSSETETRAASQFAIEALYRLGKEENFYLGGRYNSATAETAPGTEVTLNRYQLGLGWFITNNILLKAEYVNQDYLDFPTTDIRNGGNFSGGMIEATIGF